MKKQYLNPTIKNLLTRTCCRKFNSEKQVPDKYIQLILKAGQTAPSAKNRQPWYFLVIKNKACLKQIAKATFIGRQRQFANWEKKMAKKIIEGDAFNSSNDAVIVQAPIAILVFRNSDSEYKEALPAKLNIKEEQGVANTCYSMMLAAQGFGLGSVWICSPLYLKNELKEILEKYGVKWQKNWQPRAILPIGYPVKDCNKPKRLILSKICKFIS